MANNSKTDTVTEIANELFSLLGVSAKPEVTEDKENDAILVNINDSKEAGLLIGNRGRTIQAIQRFLGMAYQRRTDEWQRIIVNVADWREKEEDRLKDLALQTADRAKATQESQPLYNLTPAQRRIVHMSLVDDKEIETESVGEGRERYLVVHPKKSS